MMTGVSTGAKGTLNHLYSQFRMYVHFAKLGFYVVDSNYIDYLNLEACLMIHLIIKMIEVHPKLLLAIGKLGLCKSSISASQLLKQAKYKNILLYYIIQVGKPIWVLRKVKVLRY